MAAATGAERERKRACAPPLALRAEAAYRAVALLAVVLAAGGARAADVDSGPPARIANHYNHKAYQPTPREVCGGGNSQGIDCASRAGMEAAAKLDNVRRQIDALDKEYPPVPAGAGR